MTKTIVILGKPMGKQRPRFMRNGHTYTPDETINYETLARLEWEKQAGGYHFGNVPLGVSYKAYIEIPQSWSKKKQAEAAKGNFFPAVKPDTDNIEKIIFDSLCGVAFTDDKQFVDVHGVKRYTAKQPRVVVTITDEIEHVAEDDDKPQVSGLE